MWVTLCGILFASVLNFCSSQDTVTVTISQGQLRGRVAYTINGGNYYSFQGIPYAKPPTGELRFRPPQPAESWEGVKDALTWGSVCPQPGKNGNEDCLFINVFSTQLPEYSEENKKPVLVYIHGGGFLTGSGEIGPDYLLEQGDIVVTTINYRLGALGLISLPGTEITSNNGFKDQNLALKWIQENIAQFGGDPNKVTIWGESAGAVSVCMQTLSPMSKGLFHGVIADSGSYLTPGTVYSPGAGRSTAFQLGQYLGVSTNETSVLIEALKKSTVQEIVEATNSLVNGQLSMEIENKVGEGDEAFMPASPLDLIKQGNYNNVPLIIGINAQEGVIFASSLDNQQYVDNINQYPEGLLPWQLNVSREIGALVKEFYFGNKKISLETIMQFSNVQTDFTFVFPLLQQAKLQTAISNNPIYLYQFSFDGRFKLDPSIGDSIPGVPHIEELNYLFFNGVTLPKNTPEMITVARMVKLWTNFVKTQNPTPEEDPLLQNATWSPFTQLDHFYMDIGNDLTLSRDINKDRMGFVADIYDEIHFPE